MALVNGPG